MHRKSGSRPALSVPGGEMLQMFRDYLDVFYPDFPDTDRKYDKWRFLKV